MPYLRVNDRKRLSGAINWNAMVPASAGELNYVVSLLAGEYVKRKGLSYKTLSEVQAGIHGALVEFERRIVGPYEDSAIARNGDLAAYAQLTEEIA